MRQPNDLSRSLVALDQNSTIIAVVELSQSSWLVGGVVPGIGPVPHQRLGPAPPSPRGPVRPNNPPKSNYRDNWV
jgi:hypothetical protein